MSASYTTGLVNVKIPKDTLAVITATSDAQYIQSVTVNDTDDPPVFKGSGGGGTPLTLTADGSEYLKFEPSSSEREIGLNFLYYKKAGSQAPQNPKVQGPVINREHGLQVISFGTEDSTDNSWHDTSLTVFLFPKKTPKKA